MRTLRFALHMTQAQLARRAGISQAHVALIEAERVDPQVKTLRAIFDALYCDLAVLPVPRQRPGDVLNGRVDEKVKKGADREILLASSRIRFWD